jgi:hypothetical protein
MADTKFDIASRALVAIGANKIAAFGDGSAEEIAAGQHYESTVERCIAGTPRWRWAAAQATLNRLTDTPEARWSWAFQIPDGCLTLHAVTRAGRPVAYDRYGDKIFTDEDADLVADYTWRAPEVRFPPLWKFALEVELQAVFAGAVAKDFDLAASLRDEARLTHWPHARVEDAQQQTARRVRGSRLIAVRG